TAERAAGAGAGARDQGPAAGVHQPRHERAPAAGARSDAGRARHPGRDAAGGKRAPDRFADPALAAGAHGGRGPPVLLGAPAALGRAAARARGGPGIAAARFSARSGPLALAGEQAGDGAPVVLMHGLTATRRYVVFGSRTLERSGMRVVTYDARGHGHSAPAPDPGAYGYELLARDLQAVLEELG